MSPIAAPADRRFRRVHLKPSRRRRTWRRFVKPAARLGLGVVVLTYAVYRAALVVAHAHMLEIDRIIVKGNQRLSKEDVIAVLHGLKGESVIWTDLGAWRRRLLASSWIRDAALRRSLPSTVEVFVSEREPVGVGRISGEMYLVDEHGVVIDQYGPRYADLDLPIIDGLAAAPGEEGLLVDEARAELAARVVAAIRPRSRVARRLSQIDVSDAHNASVILTGDPAVIQLGDDEFLARLQLYLDLAPTIRQRVPEIDSVDLRFEDRIYVRPAGGAKR
jgi:cell division protein FtsQ